MHDGSCNKAYFHLLPEPVGGQTSRHRPVEKGSEQVSLKPADRLCWLSAPSMCPHFLYDLRGCHFVSRELLGVVIMGWHHDSAGVDSMELDFPSVHFLETISPDRCLITLITFQHLHISSCSSASFFLTPL